MGILLVDNGIALVAFLATAGVPLLVELGASLDVLLAVDRVAGAGRPAPLPPRAIRPRPTHRAARLMLVVVLVLPLVVRARVWRRAVAARPRLARHGRRFGGVRGRESCSPSTSCTAGPVTALGGILRVDALSAFMVIVIGVIAVLATWQGVRYLEAEIAAGRCTRAPRLALQRLRPGVLGHDAPGRVGCQPRACCGWPWRPPRW